MSDISIALVGMASAAVAFIGAMACVICLIWEVKVGMKIAGTAVCISLFSLSAALFVQAAVDRGALPTPPQDREAGE